MSEIIQICLITKFRSIEVHMLKSILVQLKLKTAYRHETMARKRANATHNR